MELFAPGDLLQAVKSKNDAEVSRLLRLGADPNECDEFGWSPLHFAAETGNAEVANLLIREFADVDLQQLEGATPVFVAAQYGSRSVVASLIEASANVSLATGRGSTPLHAAIQFEHLDCARLIADARPPPDVDCVRLDGWTPLLLAVRSRDLSLVTQLLEIPADVEQGDGNHGSSALHLAAHYGRIDIVGQLLRACASVDSQRKDGITPLYLASEDGHWEIVRQLMQGGANVNLSSRSLGVTPVFIAAQNKHARIVDLLVKASADLDAANILGETPLNIAVKLQHSTIVQKLIQAGAWLDSAPAILGKASCTPTYSASKTGNVELLLKLIKAGANIDVTTKAGLTPLYNAAVGGRTKIAELLLDSMADPNIQELEEGMTALYAAAKGGNVRIVERLLSAGANPDLTKRLSGTSPLWIAAQEGHADVVAKLIRFGLASPDLRGMAEATPLYIAAQFGHTDVVDELILATPDVDAPTKDGASPLYIAAEYNHIAVVDRLLRASANVELQEKHGCTPLWTAAQRGFETVIERLLHEHANIDHRNLVGISPLQIAAQMGHAKSVTRLIRESANTDQQDINSESSVYTATASGNLQAIKELCRACSNLDLRRANGITALWLAAEQGQQEIACALSDAQANADIQRSDGVSPIWIAAQHGYCEIVEKLIHSSADIELPKGSGSTPLYIASEFGHTEIVDLLVQGMADISNSTSTGATPMHAGAQNGHSDVVSQLIRASADVNLQRKDGASPLWLATQNGHTSAVDRLIAASANVDLGTIVSPLWIAAQNGHGVIVDKLLQAGACVDDHQHGSGSPLFVAAIVGSADVAERLICASADVDLKDEHGRNAIYMAAQGGQADVVELLIGAGADEDHRPELGSGIVNVAAQNGHANVVESLFRARFKFHSLSRQDRQVSRQLRLSINELIDLHHCLENALHMGHTKFILHFARMFQSDENLFKDCGAAMIPLLPDIVQLFAVERLQSQTIASEDLHQSLLQAGFNSVNSTLQSGTAAVLEDIVRQRFGPDVFVVGSFADGWGNCLTRLCGRTDPDSDIDVTLIAVRKMLHIRQNLIDYIEAFMPHWKQIFAPATMEPEPELECENHCCTVVYLDGHVKYESGVTCPTRPHRGSILRPAIDNVSALPCCNYPSIELIDLEAWGEFPSNTAQQLTKVRDGTQCHVVAASPPGLEGKRMRVSTNMLERQLMQSLTSVQGQLFIIIKYLIKRVLTKRVKGLKTYHAKNLLFYMLEKTPETYWTPKNLIGLVRESLEMLVEYLSDSLSEESSCMKHFFLRDAQVYLRKGHDSKLEIANAVEFMIDELPALLLEFQRSLMPSETSMVEFHPFLLIPFPHKVSPTIQKQTSRAMGYHEIYDLVRNLLIRLGSEETSNQETHEQLLQDIGLLPDCATTAREGLRALALLKVGKSLEEDNLVTSVSKGVRCPLDGVSVDEAKTLVWYQIEHSDSAWKFCFEISMRPAFRYLRKKLRLAFPWGSGNYSNMVYMNFDALLKGLRLEYFKDKADTSSAEELFSDVVSGDADPQELLMILNYCTDESVLVRAIHNNKDMISDASLDDIVVNFIQERPSLVNLCRENTLETLVNVIDSQGIIERLHHFLPEDWKNQSKI